MTAACLVLALPGCDRGAGGGPGAQVELDSGSVSLPAGAQLRDVRVSGRAGSERVEPDSLRAAPGDAIRFTAGDALTHAIAFDTTAMQPAARSFLQRTGQVSSPPLLGEGSSWVVSLEDAPPGVYAFRCLAHGATGRITVVAPPGRR